VLFTRTRAAFLVVAGLAANAAAGYVLEPHHRAAERHR
jgi:hypothetical protein